MAAVRRGWNAPVVILVRTGVAFAHHRPWPAREYLLVLPSDSQISFFLSFDMFSSSESCDLLNDDRRSSTRNSLFLFNLDGCEDGQVSVSHTLLKKLSTTCN